MASAADSCFDNNLARHILLKVSLFSVLLYVHHFVTYSVEEFDATSPHFVEKHLSFFYSHYFFLFFPRHLTTTTDSVAGFDAIRGSTFVDNTATSSGGALVHAGVMQEISDSEFKGNRAGNEGPAVLSLGQIDYMGGVTFDDNDFFCQEGTFSMERQVGRTEGATVRYYLL